MVRTMKPLKETENIEMNRKVLEALIALGCYKKEAFLVAFKGCFNLYLGDRVRSGLTRTDLKQISRIADKMDMDRPVDVHQPLQVHALDKSPLIKRAKVPLSKLRLAI